MTLITNKQFHIIIITSISSCLFCRSVEFVALIGVSCTLFLFLHTQSLTTRLREMEDKLQPSMSAGGLISGIANNLIQGKIASGRGVVCLAVVQSSIYIISKTIYQLRQKRMCEYRNWKGVAKLSLSLFASNAFFFH